MGEKGPPLILPRIKFLCLDGPDNLKSCKTDDFQVYKGYTYLQKPIKQEIPPMSIELKQTITSFSTKLDQLQEYL
ncbi:MAG: hypothetical protein V1793_07385 [Pseudomonadota bacterium]